MRLRLDSDRRAHAAPDTKPVGLTVSTATDVEVLERCTPGATSMRDLQRRRGSLSVSPKVDDDDDETTNEEDDGEEEDANKSLSAAAASSEGDGGFNAAAVFTRVRIIATRAAMRKVVQRVAMVVFAFSSDDLGRAPDESSYLSGSSDGYTHSSATDDARAARLGTVVEPASKTASFKTAESDGDVEAKEAEAWEGKEADAGDDRTAAAPRPLLSSAAAKEGESSFAGGSATDEDDDYIDGDPEISDCGLESSDESVPSVAELDTSHRHNAIVAATWCMLKRTEETPLPGDSGPSADDIDAKAARDRNVAMAKRAVVAAERAKYAAERTTQMPPEGVPRELVHAAAPAAVSMEGMTKKERRRSRKRARAAAMLRKQLQKQREAQFKSLMEAEKTDGAAYEVCCAPDLVVLERHSGLRCYRTLSEALAAVSNVPTVIIWMHAGLYFESVSHAFDAAFAFAFAFCLLFPHVFLLSLLHVYTGDDHPRRAHNCARGGGDRGEHQGCCCG